VGDAEAFEAGSEPEGAVVAETFGGTDERQLVGRCGAEARPDAETRELRQLRHIALGAFEHASENGGLGAGIVVAVLAGGTDQELPGGARLDVERDRVGLDGMSALQIAKLDELMIEEAGITVGDEQVAFAFFDWH